MSTVAFHSLDFYFDRLSLLHPGRLHVGTRRPTAEGHRSEAPPGPLSRLRSPRDVYVKSDEPYTERTREGGRLRRRTSEVEFPGNY